MNKLSFQLSDSPEFWVNVSSVVYNTFAECIIPVINNEFLPEVYQEVTQKISDGSLLCGEFIHEDKLLFKNDIWFSIHMQIHNNEEINEPLIRVFAIPPFEGYSPYVLRLYFETDKQNQLDVYPPHFFKQYAARAEQFSEQARKLGREYKRYTVFPTAKRENLEKKCINPLHFFIGLFVAQNWFFLKTNNRQALSREEQTENNSVKKWTLVATDSVIFGRTQIDEHSPFTLNVYLTNVGYEMLGLDQKAILLPLKEELERRYVAYTLK